MKHGDGYSLGIMFRREYAPEALPDFARRAEKAGFDELWVVEDCFYTSGIASAATALACTQSIKVGLGIMPAVARNPVFTAMEIATLARLYPGRFLPGIGHGLASWMRQIGAFPRSQINALEEVTAAIRELLTGKELTFHGQHVQLDRAKLVHPPAQIPPISLGVIGPKSLSLSGRVADGTILSEYSAPAYVSWAKEQIMLGKAQGSQNPEHRLTVFAFACAASTTAAARNKLRPMITEAIASGGIEDAKLAPMGILDQTRGYRQEALGIEIPDDWIDQLTIAGTREDWRHAMARLAASGVQTIVLTPLPDAGISELDVFAQHLFS